MLPLVWRTAKSFSAWLAPAGGEAALELRPDLDQVQGLTGEREQLWARLNAASFLKIDEKRAAVGYSALDAVSDPPGQTPLLKYSPDQPRVPSGNSDGGQWTDGGGSGGAGGGGGRNDPRVLSDATPDDFWRPGAQLANNRGGRPRREGQGQLTIGGRQYIVNGRQDQELRSASERAQIATERLRQLDPDWKPMPSLRDTSWVTETESAIRFYRDLAQEAQARLAVIDRGFPHGFSSRREFEEFGRFTQEQLISAGHQYVEVHIRGSALSGYSYETGRPFDVGRRSDYDLALVSPTLLRRAAERGIELRGRRSRTRPLEEADLRELQLLDVVKALKARSRRPVSFVIYESQSALQARGPSVPMQ